MDRTPEWGNDNHLSTIYTVLSSNSSQVSKVGKSIKDIEAFKSEEIKGGFSVEKDKMISDYLKDISRELSFLDNSEPSI